jgi:hypothetical protein
MEKKENYIIPNRKNTSPIPINNFLSLKKLIPFENHPSARGLMKNEQTEKLPQSITIPLEKNDNKENKQSSDFKIILEKIDEKIYQNEVYFQKNENEENIEYIDYNSMNNNNKKSDFTKEEEDFDKDITDSIIKKEKAKIIINKFQNFVNIKKTV